jgi:hypothetical protein
VVGAGLQSLTPWVAAAAALAEAAAPGKGEIDGAVSDREQQRREPFGIRIWKPTGALSRGDHANQ